MVRRESEWDDYTRSRVFAMERWRALRCPQCLNYDSLVLLPKDERLVTWDEHGGRKFTVDQYRCLACGAADLVRRDTATRFENTKPIPGQAAPFDGRMYVARPAEEV